MLSHSRKVAIVVTALYVALLIFLFHRHFSPFGVWSAELKAPATKTRLMSGPTPQLRVEVDDAQEFWRIKEPPVYFEVNNPKKFDQAELEVEFRGDAPIIEVGVVKSQDPWRVEKRVLYHEYLEELSWQRIEEDGLVLWQREPRYESVEEFLENPPAVEEVATVDTGFFMSVILNPERFRGEESRGKRTGSLAPLGMTEMAYVISLRGPQDIYLYTAGEDIEVKFLFQDMNRHDGADEVELKLYRNPSPPPSPAGRGGLSTSPLPAGEGQGEGTLVVYETLLDDGIVWGNRESKPPRELTVSRKQPQPGVYRLAVSTTDDIFIRRIETKQKKMVWKNTLYLGDEVGYRDSVRPVTVYSNGQGYALRTPHPESVQEVEFVPLTPALSQRERGSDSIMLLEHNKQYSIQMSREVAGDVLAITVPKRDTVLTTDGFFALSSDAFFLPEPMSYMSDLDLSRLGINYVLARYEKTKRGGGGSHTGRVPVTIHDIEQNEPLQFFVGTPHGEQQSMEIWEVKVKLTKPRLTFSRIRAKIKDILNL